MYTQELEEEKDAPSALPAAMLGAGSLAYGAHHLLKNTPGIDPKTHKLIEKFLALRQEADPKKLIKGYADTGAALVRANAFGRSGRDIIQGIRRSGPFKALERLGIARKFTPESAKHYEEFARGGAPALRQLHREVGRSPTALAGAAKDALKSYSPILRGIQGADFALRGIQRVGRYGLPLAAIGALGLGYQHLAAKKQEGRKDALREYGLPEDQLK